MSEGDERMKNNKKKKGIKVLLVTETILLMIFLVVLIFYQTGRGKRSNGSVTPPLQQKQPDILQEDKAEKEAERIKEQQLVEERQKEKKKKAIETLLVKADTMAQGYFYDEAIEEIKNFEGDYTQEVQLTEAIERYESEKNSLVPYKGEISHVFFHSLIADNSKAFDGDGMENGYNYWMTTVSEFNKMLEQMYGRGYVLVSIHDVAGLEGESYQSKQILLPEGKIPFVLSQDDVNYYEYMKKDGFASRIVLDEQGRPACEIEIDGEKKVARDYDVVPLLDLFVEKHPDFSYRGAKGIIALTGYPHYGFLL